METCKDGTRVVEAAAVAGAAREATQEGWVAAADAAV